MKTNILKKLQATTYFLVIASSFVVFSSLEKDEPNLAASQCCSGYTITAANLKKFMLDSLKRNQFEGGVYSKADLLAVINSLSSADDSVYLLNILPNCDVNQGTDLALTSAHTTDIKYVRVRQCQPCPNRPCCRNSVCVAKISRKCISYIPYTPGAITSENANNSLVFSETADQ